MSNEDKQLNLFMNYSFGNYMGPLTKKECSDIKASWFAMELLVPTKKLYKLLRKKYCCEDVLEISPDSLVAHEIAHFFEVPHELVAVKLHLLQMNLVKGNCKKI